MENTSTSTCQIVLASASPRRRELLALLGLPFRVVPAEIDEAASLHQAPEQIVLTLAREKALQVASRESDAVILGADTIVRCAGEVLGKPRDTDEALQMLRRLNGSEHQVYTGMAFLKVSDGVVVDEQMDVVCTRVWFRRVSDEHLRRYVATGEPMDKAGAYGAQGYGATLIERIDGCYFNVVGLPVSRLCVMLEKWGFAPLSAVAGKTA